jgi:hypothetical protein
MAILAPVGILFLIQIYQERRQGFGKAFLNAARIFMLWLILLVGAYIVFWPGMWVAPQKMLYEVYGNAFSYAFQGSRLAVTGELESSRFSLNLGITGILSLIEMLLRRTTLLAWIGILFGFALLRQKESIYKILFTLLWITAAAFILMFGIAQGRDSPHYILCSYLALNLLAGLGWFYSIKALEDRFASLRLQYIVLPLLLFFQVWSAVPFFPYYFTYQNPVTYQYYDDKDFPLFPYGEGLELAGQYLAGLPNAKDSTALVYYSRGCFSYFYPGVTNGFKPYYVDGAHAEDLLNSIRSVNYLVVYYPVQGQISKYAGYVKALTGAKPIHEVWLDGRRYVLIYQVDQIPESVFESLAKLKPLQP